MKFSLLNLIFFILVAISAPSAAYGQQPAETPVKRLNFRYSQNPKAKSISTINNEKIQNENNSAIENDSNLNEDLNSEVDVESLSIASKTLEIAKRANDAAASSPTEIYKVGVGDVLFISLQNAPTKAANYFTILNDGTIDYPLAGEMISVQGLQIEEIEDLLKEKIKLFENPQVSVKIREHASHSITVLGLVEKAGEKFLQREAMPLYVIRAEAVVTPRADVALIKRANGESEKIELGDAKADNVLIFPGDIVEFKAETEEIAALNVPQFYFIGGAVALGGQKEFHNGITLTQAILASGGLKKSNVKSAVLRRKNENGLLSPLEFNLDAIKNGKQPDPVLQAGDTIEVGN